MTGATHENILVGGFNPSEKYVSVGMIIPNIWRKNNHVPNHQPVYDHHPEIVTTPVGNRETRSWPSSKRI